MAAKARRSGFLLILAGIAVTVVIAINLAGRGASRDDASARSRSSMSGSDPIADRLGQTVSEQGSGAASTADTAAEAADGPRVGANGANSDAPADSTRVPIPIPAEFAAIFERNEDLAAFHAMLESEAEDSDWALGVEQYLERHFNATLDLSQWRVLTIECRSTSCEILATGYGDDSMRGWMQSVAQLFENEDQFEALIGGPGIGSCGGGDLAPGVFAVNCTIQRSGEEPPASTVTEVFPLDTPYPDDVSVDSLPVDGIVVPAIESDREAFDLHRRLEQEPVDYAWAGYVEPLIADYLGGLDPERGLGLLGVTCRSTLCEVQMIARDEEVAMVEWVSTMLDFLRLEGHGLIPAGGNDSTIDNGAETGIVWFLERVPQN